MTGDVLDKNIYLSLTAFHDDQLLLRGGTGEDDLGVVFQNVVQLLGAQVLQVTPVHYTSLCISS